MKPEIQAETKMAFINHSIGVVFVGTREYQGEQIRQQLARFYAQFEDGIPDYALTHLHNGLGEVAMCNGCYILGTPIVDSWLAEYVEPEYRCPACYEKAGM